MQSAQSLELESNGWSSNGLHSALANWQLGADVLIAVAYFCISSELGFYILKAQIRNRGKLVITQFGLFILLCGVTHMLTVWNYVVFSNAAHVCMTVAKMAAAAVSLSSAAILFRIIPEFLDVKKREEFYTKKSAELNREVMTRKKDQQVSNHVLMLTDEIRSSLNRHTILNKTMVELARTLSLESCNIWTSKMDGATLELTYSIGVQDIFTREDISIHDPVIQMVFSRSGTVKISKAASSKQSCVDVPEQDAGNGAVAIRIPLLQNQGQKYSLMALAREDPWDEQAFQLIEAVADQVAVALSHAAMVEEAIATQIQLLQQNSILQRAMQEAEAAVVARDEFLIVMNHEMRTPMHAIIALSSLLLDSDISPDQWPWVEALSKNGTVLSLLINNVLDITRSEIGTLALDTHSFLLQNFLIEAMRLVLPMAEAKNLQVSLNQIGELPLELMADNKRMLQVFLNVVGNSVQFTEEGHIDIRVYCTKDETLSMGIAPPPGKKIEYNYLYFEVQDTGIGIDFHQLNCLFDKVVGAESTSPRSGMGLITSKKFVELMGGKLTVESQGLGKGTTCRFSVVVAALLNKELDVTKAPSKRMGDLNVLVVDDSSINRIVTQRLLKHIGCKSTVVESGQKCLQILSEEGASTFDIILLDLCMPEMDGFEVATEVFKTYPKKERPLVVALTANSDEKTRNRCIEVGLDGVLHKPITLKTMESELKYLMESCEARPPFCYQRVLARFCNGDAGKRAEAELRDAKAELTDAKGFGD